MRLIATVLLTAIQAVRACMLAAGTAALIAVAFVLGSPSPEWFGPVRQLSLTVGPVLLGAAALGFALLPSRRELARLAPDPSEGRLPEWLYVSLALLAAGSMWQLGQLLSWWGDSQAIVETLTEGVRDPLGLWILPAALLGALPFAASLTVALFLLTSGIVLNGSSRPSAWVTPTMR